MLLLFLEDGRQEVCGDGLIVGAEDGDDGKQGNNDGCRTDCMSEVCGDGMVISAKECDDGNFVGGDGCNAD